jgi:hypothetical protein
MTYITGRYLRAGRAGLYCGCRTYHRSLTCAITETDMRHYGD